MKQVSGLDTRNRYCIDNQENSNGSKLSIGECAEFIGRQALSDAPGTRLRYGASHWYVAAHMAETVTGKSWNALFDEYIKIPMNLTNPDFQFAQWFEGVARSQKSYKYTSTANGGYGYVLDTLNGNPAAGMLATANEYRALMQLILNRGRYNGKRIIHPSLIDLMFYNRFPNARVPLTEIYTLAGFYGYRLGFGTVLFCSKSSSQWKIYRFCPTAGMVSVTGKSTYVYRNSHTANVFTSVGEGVSAAASALSVEVLRRDIDDMIYNILN